MKKLQKKDINFFSLKELKNKKSELYNNTIEWLLHMKEESDGKAGPSFSRWIKKNLMREHPFDTYIIVEREYNRIIGIGSILPDDQSVGKELKIPGIWIGGIYIKKEDRGRGAGSLLVQHLISRIQEASKNNNTIIRVNLFAHNPIAQHIYKKLGFIKIDDLTVYRDGFNCEVYYRKL
ncbi:hypothetical protein COT48_01945 [Candidatus Woesearchaeota archaeon CG08_land_8_20_14_0_20_47_9]|nr:MAG: hypothetical protein AUJ69_02240 [Candidatus Woesearchaeota archaeon CG1_02_47_18]PIO04147.1 MAG: hypothetical protein COT48_01945 [Candidatus Woesearchaeota archaeon CG08_land_8_20_14_0_20_47_9]